MSSSFRRVAFRALAPILLASVVVVPAARAAEPGQTTPTAAPAEPTAVAVSAPAPDASPSTAATTVPADDSQASASPEPAGSLGDSPAALPSAEPGAAELAAPAPLAAGPAQAAIPVDVSPTMDPAFQACLNGILGQAATAPITDAQLAGITNTVDCSNRGVTSLKGAEYLTGTTEFIASRNDITNLTPLSGLSGLAYLDLSLNPHLADITELGKLANLTVLTLSGGNIIGDGLKPGWVRGENSGPGWGISLVAGTGLVSDITPLASLTKLTQLSLDGNRIADVSPLKALTGLARLNLFANRISDLGPLFALTRLAYLDLSSNSIKDVTPVAKLTALTTLKLNGNAISSLWPLSQLSSLTTIGLANNGLTYVGALSSLHNLTSLDLDDNNIDDLSELSIDPAFVSAYSQVLTATGTSGDTVAWPWNQLRSAAGDVGVTVQVGPATVNPTARTITYTGAGRVVLAWTAAGSSFSGLMVVNVAAAATPPKGIPDLGAGVGWASWATGVGLVILGAASLWLRRSRLRVSSL